MIKDHNNPSRNIEPSALPITPAASRLSTLERLLVLTWALLPGLACVIGMELVGAVTGRNLSGQPAEWLFIIEMVLVVAIILHFQAWFPYMSGMNRRISSDASRIQGELDRSQDELNLSIENLNQAIKIKPLYTDAYLQRGIAYERQGDFSRALADFDKAIELQPGRADCYVTRGISHYKRGDLDYAIDDLSMAIRLYPHCKTLFTRGVAYHEKGKVDPAIDDFTAAIPQDPPLQNAVPFNALKDDYVLIPYVGGVSYSRGLACLGKGDLQHAIRDFSTAISSDQDFIEAYYGRGLAYYCEGDYDQAIADFDRAIAADPEFTEAYLRRGNTHSMNGDYGNAVIDYGKVIEKEPENSQALSNRSRCHFMMGEYAKALQDAIRSLEREPENVHYLDLRARTYKALGYTEDAIADFERIIQLGDDSHLSQQAAEELKEFNHVPSLPSIDRELSTHHLLELSQWSGRRWVGRSRVGGLAWDLRSVMAPQWLTRTINYSQSRRKLRFDA